MSDTSRAAVYAQELREGSPIHYCAPFERTLLESSLPFRELSQLAKADRRSKDPVYGAHRWWARRPPSVMRGLLLAAALPSDAGSDQFWGLYRSGRPLLAGWRVHDSFVGGGTVLVEAARLGAQVSGTDTDPLAVEIVRQELLTADARAVRTSIDELLSYVRARAAHLYAARSKTWEPLHYFFLRRVECPVCNKTDLVYRTPVIARDAAKVGAVVRDADIVAFCPACLKVHELPDGRKQLRCCATAWPLDRGTFKGHRFWCSHCGSASAHEQLKTGAAERVLVAVEETSAKERRRIRSARECDRALLGIAKLQLTNDGAELLLPRGSFLQERRDSRPVSFGITRYSQSLSERQQVVFGHAFARASQIADDNTRRSLTLALSNALTTNNALCGYATDYGRLAPLFSVRSYALPALSVELNPFHSGAGRGTLNRAFQKLERSLEHTVKRYVWDPARRRPVPEEVLYQHRVPTAGVSCGSAVQPPAANEQRCTLAIFDPPYYDYISYSELSEFYRAWLRQPRLGGVPLLPSRQNPATSFASMLTAALDSIVQRLEAGRPAAFTFHSTSSGAWQAIAKALAAARLRVTAMWPLMNDSHMGHHAADGNCEWDLVVVCRRASETEPSPCPVSVKSWANALGTKLRMLKADRRALACALDELGGICGRTKVNSG